MPGPTSELSVKSRAFPTIGLILLGGISDRNSRIPRHTSAGFAYTGLNDDIFVETELYSSDKEEGYVNNEKIDLDGDRSPFKLINRYKEKILKNNVIENRDLKFSFRSRNVGVLSGSSDGAAAAIGKCVEFLYKDNLDWGLFENELRMISESVGRSVYGGMTITPAADMPVTERILNPMDFRDYVVVGCKFKVERKPSDRIHENVVNSPNYGKRIESTRKKGEIIRNLSEDRDIKGIFELAMDDTEEYHRLIESVGVRVITTEMRNFITRVRELRKDTWMTYIVTGGSNVFVPIEKKYYRLIMDEASDYDATPVPLKVAEGASILE